MRLCSPRRESFVKKRFLLLIAWMACYSHAAIAQDSPPPKGKVLQLKSLKLSETGLTSIKSIEMFAYVPRFIWTIYQSYTIAEGEEIKNDEIKEIPENNELPPVLLPKEVLTPHGFRVCLSFIGDYFVQDFEIGTSCHFLNAKKTDSTKLVLKDQSGIFGEVSYRIVKQSPLVFEVLNITPKNLQQRRGKLSRLQNPLDPNPKVISVRIHVLQLKKEEINYPRHVLKKAEVFEDGNFNFTEDIFLSQKTYENSKGYPICFSFTLRLHNKSQEESLKQICGHLPSKKGDRNLAIESEYAHGYFDSITYELRSFDAGPFNNLTYSPDSDDQVFLLFITQLTFRKKMDSVRWGIKSNNAYKALSWIVAGATVEKSNPKFSSKFAAAFGDIYPSATRTILPTDKYNEINYSLYYTLNNLDNALLLKNIPRSFTLKIRKSSLGDGDKSSTKSENSATWDIENVMMIEGLDLVLSPRNMHLISNFCEADISLWTLDLH